MNTHFAITPATRTAHGWSKALLLLLLACVLMQGTAVQAHVHLRPASLAVAEQSSGETVAARKQVASAVCELCLEGAMSGHYLLASAAALPEPPVLVLGIDPRSIPEFRLLSRAIGWLSRAPPQ